MGDGMTIAQLGLPRDALSGQVAVVTGAGRGLGRETARALAYLGAAVVVAEVDEGAGLETVALVNAQGGRALFVRTDVADEASVDVLAARTLSQFGQADLLVNNAILSPVASVLEMDVAVWDRTIAVNLRGTFLACKAFLPGMLARRRGTVVNMVSTEAMPYLSAYIASKMAIAGLSQSLAGEVGEQGVCVVAFGPGFVDTPGLRESGRRLAPRLGMTEQQFLSLSLHPGYDGMMPASDAGAATGYLVARLAGEYHGEVVDGYTILERSGYLRAPVAAPAPQPPGRPSPVAAVEQAVSQARRLEEVVAAIEAEFGQLPLFARPLARSGFRKKAGQSIRDWQRTAGELAARLERIRAGDVVALRELLPDYHRLAGLLEQLVRYLEGVPAETARFTRGEELLRQVRATTVERVAIVQALSRALRDVVGA